jgi:hypothetical protein
MREISEDEFWQLYKNIPLNQQKAIFSEKTAKIIRDLSSRYKLNSTQEQKLPEIVGNLLLNLFSLSDLSLVLQEELNIEPVLAEDFKKEINAFILAPPSLEETSSTVDKYRESLS